MASAKPPRPPLPPTKVAPEEAKEYSRGNGYPPNEDTSLRRAFNTVIDHIEVDKTDFSLLVDFLISKGVFTREEWNDF